MQESKEQRSKGRLEYARVGLYEGTVSKIQDCDVPSGEGKLTYYQHHDYQDESYCTGTFNEAGALIACKEAKLKYHNGDWLEGGIGGEINECGRYSGPCTLYYKGHTDELPHYMKGIFKDGRADGQVTVVDQSHTITCQWKDDELEEKEAGTMEIKENGELIGKYTGTFRYEGKSQRILQHGQGRYEYLNNDDMGAVHEGAYKGGFAHGEGKFTHSKNNTIFEYYEGQFEHGKAQGNGTLKFKDTFEEGLILKGEFEDNNSKDETFLSAYSKASENSKPLFLYRYKWREDNKINIWTYNLKRKPLIHEVLSVYRNSENRPSNDDCSVEQKQDEIGHLNQNTTGVGHIETRKRKDRSDVLAESLLGAANKCPRTPSSTRPSSSPLAFFKGVDRQQQYFDPSELSSEEASDTEFEL